MYLLTSVILLYLGSHLGIRWWIAREKERLAENSRIVLTALGPVECSIRGDGPAVLIVPGCPGGYDHALLAGELLGSPRLRLIAISRPGYLRTPLGSHVTPEAQADVYAALLDALGIRCAAVVGVSGGGPSALQFVLRYPNRCFALATVSAISQRMTTEQMNNCKSLARRTVGAVFSVFYVLTRRLGWPINQRNGAVLYNLYVGLLRSFFLTGLNRVGLRNDMSQLLALPNYSLREIFVPTLVMHGTGDTIVPYSHAEFIARQVPEVTEISVPGGGHLFFAKESHRLTPKVIEFLEEHTGEPGFVCDRRTGV